MKKNLFVLVVMICSMCMFLPSNVNAAYAYSWTVNGENLSRGSSNTSGTASWVEDENYTGGVLILNNYDGGQLNISCFGTGLGHVFAIKLVGNNKITVKDGIGILAGAPIVFIGDGKLEITAAIPIGGGYVHTGENTMMEIERAEFTGDTTVTIEPSKSTEVSKCPTVDEINENQSNDKKEESDDRISNDSKKDESSKDDKKSNSILSNNNVVNIAVLVYFALSLITIIVLGIKLKSHKKKSDK